MPLQASSACLEAGSQSVSRRITPSHQNQSNIEITRTLERDLRADLNAAQNWNYLAQALHDLLGRLLHGLAAFLELLRRARVSADGRGRYKMRHLRGGG